MTACEDVYESPDYWFLPVRGAVISYPLAPALVAGERLVSGDAVSLGSDNRLHLVRGGAVPFAVMGTPYSEGEIVPIRAGQGYPHGAVALRPSGCFDVRLPETVPPGAVHRIELELAPPGSDVVGFVTRVLEPGETWSNRAPSPPLSLAEVEADARIRAAPVFPVGPWEDGVTAELVALASAGDEARFRELASCVMPPAEVNECWTGTRTRLGL